MFGLKDDIENELWKKKMEEEKKVEARKKEREGEKKEITQFFTAIEKGDLPKEEEKENIAPKEVVSYLDKSGIFAKFIINETSEQRSREKS